MGRKKNSGYGSIYYNKQRNNYIASYKIHNETTGEEKIVRKTFDTSEQAKDYLNSLETKKDFPIFQRNGNIPLYEVMKLVEERKFKANITSPQQYGKNMELIKKFEKLPIGQKDATFIKSEELQSYFNTLSNYSNSYIDKHLCIFSQAFNYLFKKGIIKINPLADTVKTKSKKSNKVIRPLEVEEQEKFTQFLMSKTIQEVPYKNVFLIQLYMGLRIGEALALQYNDIDLEHNIVHITKTLTKDDKGNVIIGNSTKTFAGIRDLPIPHNIKNNIIEQKEISKNNMDNMLFVSKTGDYVRPQTANVILQRLLIDCDKITGISTHSLRHTFGTRCIEAGMSPVVVQRLLGHKDISITLNTYTSVLDKFRQDELNKVNAYYTNNKFFDNSNKDSNSLER